MLNVLNTKQVFSLSLFMNVVEIYYNFENPVTREILLGTSKRITKINQEKQTLHWKKKTVQGSV